jgi:hypothetical protein
MAKKAKAKNRKSKGLLLAKQRISVAKLDSVTGGGEISGLASAAASIVGSASSSLETPSGVITGAVSGALSAYNSNHWSDYLSFKK